MAQSKKRAPSLWLTYTYEKPGDILMQDVLVPSSGLAKCTYYCCLNWNISREGGGYCGIQDHPEGRAFIFSIWDPQQVKDIPITAVTKGLGTWTERFGGEGTGLKSMNFELGWKEGQWYTLVVRRWDASGGQATRFGCWVHDQQEDTWTHLITMEYPVPRVYFEGVTASFLEDWGFTSEHYRCVHYRGGFKRQVDKTWTPFSKAEFKVNMYDVSNGTATTNFEAKKCSDPTEGVCIAAGGTVQGDQDTCCVFEDPAQDCRPPKKPVKLKKVETKDGVLNWVVEKGSTPQFGFRVKLADQELCCGQGEFITETRLASCVQSNEEGNGTVVVEVEDILGNCDQQSCELSRS